ncbi:MAG: hypothetical protein ABI151_04220 [Chitinophagaceae bacterium]
MKKINGILLLFISIALTSISTVFKIADQVPLSQILVVAGMVSFIAAIGIIVYSMARPGRK